MLKSQTYSPGTITPYKSKFLIRT